MSVSRTLTRTLNAIDEKAFEAELAASALAAHARLGFDEINEDRVLGAMKDKLKVLQQEIFNLTALMAKLS